MSDRIVGGNSLHEAEKPELCPGGVHSTWRCVDCCKREPDRDVVECERCGKQKSWGCTFDEDFA